MPVNIGSHPYVVKQVRPVKTAYVDLRVYKMQLVDNIPSHLRHGCGRQGNDRCTGILFLQD